MGALWAEMRGEQKFWVSQGVMPVSMNHDSWPFWLKSLWVSLHAPQPVLRSSALASVLCNSTQAMSKAECKDESCWAGVCIGSEPGPPHCVFSFCRDAEGSRMQHLLVRPVGPASIWEGGTDVFVRQETYPGWCFRDGTHGDLSYYDYWWTSMPAYMWMCSLPWHWLYMGRVYDDPVYGMSPAIHGKAGEELRDAYFAVHGYGNGDTRARRLLTICGSSAGTHISVSSTRGIMRPGKEASMGARVRVAVMAMTFPLF